MRESENEEGGDKKKILSKIYYYTQHIFYSEALKRKKKNLNLKDIYCFQ